MRRMWVVAATAASLVLGIAGAGPARGDEICQPVLSESQVCVSYHTRDDRGVGFTVDHSTSNLHVHAFVGHGGEVCVWYYENTDPVVHECV